MINFSSKKILVIGDIMVDEYIWGTVSRISPEAPVPVVLAKSESIVPGGAANVAANVVSLSAKSILVGVCGNDPAGKKLLNRLKILKVNTDGIVLDSERPTSLKTRIVAHNQQIVRVDKEKSQAINSKIVDRLVNHVKRTIKEIDAIIISDYAKGVACPELISRVIEIALDNKKVIAVDPKTEHFFLYKNVTLIKPNRSEAYKVLNFIESRKLEEVGYNIQKRINCKNLLITLGEHGMALFRKDKPVETIKTAAKEVYDVTGAGDTVIATMTLALSCGVDSVSAVRLANQAAGIVVGEVGTVTIKYSQLKEYMSRL